jgi:hypothetical protein
MACNTMRKLTDFLANPNGAPVSQFFAIMSRHQGQLSQTGI